MAANEQLKTVLSFLNEVDIKDLVFLLSKSPSRKQFDEIRTVENLLTALEKWYGLDAVPCVLYQALEAADQHVLAVCIRKVCQKTTAHAIVKTAAAPNRLRRLMFDVISKFPDSKAVDLHNQMRLPNIPAPRDSLDLMASLLELRFVTESQISLLRLFSPLNPGIEDICRQYETENGIVHGAFDVGGDDRGGQFDTRRQRNNLAPAIEDGESHPMNDPVCIIMNVNNVPGKPPRTGSEKDVDRLVQLFKKFRYQVFKWTDPNRQKYDEYLQVLKMQLRLFGGGLVFFVMSHGHENYVHLADGNQLHYKTDIIAPFLDGCLRGKPKIFCFQCCRGEQLQRVISYDGTSDQERLEQFRDQDNKELYVFHATFEGFAAIREDAEGSWFIQTLCDKLDVPQRVELEDLRRSVLNEMGRRVALVGCEQVSQTPQADMNTMSKRVYLKPA